MSTYRTRTYIAGDWDNDSNAVEQLRKWNESDHWSLSFTDAHDLMSARDNSLNCSIKSSLKKRMDASKTFVLIVGDHTNTVTAGGCQYCDNYNATNAKCSKGYSIDYRSYIKYECDKAVEAGIKLIVLYKSTTINKNKCPESVRYKGNHATMIYKGDDGKYYWDYQSVKDAFEK